MNDLRALLKALHERTRPVAVRVGPRTYRILRPAEAETVEGKIRHVVTWSTPQGPVSLPQTTAGKAVQSLPPHLRDSYVRVRAGMYVRRNLLSSVRKENHAWKLTMRTTPPRQTTVRERTAPEVANALGVPDLNHLAMTPVQLGLWWEGVRDFDEELLWMEPERLRRMFLDPQGKVEPRRLLANFIWELYRRPRVGRTLSYDLPITARSFIYRPVYTVLRELGVGTIPAPRLSTWTKALFEMETTDAPWLQSVAWTQALLGMGTTEVLLSVTSSADVISSWTRALLGLLTCFVGDYRAFTYSELGFVDPKPQMRTVGTKRRHIVLMAEKEELRPLVLQACEKWDISAIVLNGFPSWMETDFFQRALGTPQVHLIGLTDYDPAGWEITEHFASQLARYGTSCTSITHLIRPDMLPASDVVHYQTGERADKWMAKGGGIDGRAACFHSDDVWPRSRILDAINRRISEIETHQSGTTSKRKQRPGGGRTGAH